MTLSSSNVSKSRVKIVSNIIISFIGAGMLGLPFAFREAGVIGGPVILVITAILSTVSMLMIVKCKYKTAKAQFINDQLPENVEMKSMEAEGVAYKKLGDEAETSDDMSFDLVQYSDIGYESFGKTGRLLVDLAIIFSQLGFCCAYLIFISENVTNYFPTVKKWQCILVCALIVSSMTMFRNLANLGYFSFIAQCTQLIAFAMVIWFDFTHIRSENNHIEYVQKTGFPFVFAFSIYCFEGAGMILALESSMHLSIRSKFKKYLIIILVGITMGYIFFGTSGYLSFGHKTNSVITLNLVNNGPKVMARFAVAVKICLCFSLLLTYPVMMFPVSQLLDKKLKLRETKWAGNLLRAFMVVSTVVVVLLIDKFEVLMGFIGATCCSSLAYILPGMFHFKLMKNCCSKKTLLFDVFMVLFGFTIMTFGIMDAVNRVNAS